MLRVVIQHNRREFKNYCYNAMLRNAGMTHSPPTQGTAVTTTRMFLSTSRQFLSRAEETTTTIKPNNYKRAKDILKSIEEKEAMEKKKATEAATATKKAEAAAANAQAAVNATTTKTPAPATAPKKTLWQKIKAEATHYWHGTRLLGLEVRISSRLIWKMLKGTKLTRRENRQLRRTTSDIVRLVPFAVFLIVPFMELLLPVALKLFPNMLPSTFENKKLEEEKKRKLLKVRIEMARFLQETIAESGTTTSSSKSAKKEGDGEAATAGGGGQEFINFFRKMRMTGEQASTEDLLKIASKFEDELTLDNLSRPQLVSMCRYMNINAFGTDNFLRFNIRNRMRQIKMDDKVIQQEGIDNLTLLELHNACAARGIRTVGTTPTRLRDELKQWIELHLEHRVPSTLLILSRAFSYTDANMSSDDALRATFNSLPDNLVNEAELHVMEMTGASTYKQKLDVLEQQEELIEDESEQEEKEEKARQAEEEESTSKKEKEDSSATFTKEDKDDQKRKSGGGKKETTISEEQKEEEYLSQDDLHEALSKLRTKVDNLEQRAQLNEIKFHYEDYKDVIEELKAATHNESNASPARLGKKLEKMLNEIDKGLDQLENSSKEEEEQEQAEEKKNKN